jgi:hypothetical protein
VTLNPNVRFWGTINYDETTERLSPRTLDRTGMIFLGDADVKPTLEGDAAPPPGVAARDLFARFLRDAEDCPEERWELVSQVIDFLRSPDASLGPRVELSPRVQRAIKRYLANSVDVLAPHTSVDFVVQQRILPVVRGRGRRLPGADQPARAAALRREPAPFGGPRRGSAQAVGAAVRRAGLPQLLVLRRCS